MTISAILFKKQIKNLSRTGDWRELDGNEKCSNSEGFCAVCFCSLWLCSIMFPSLFAGANEEKAQRKKREGVREADMARDKVNLFFPSFLFLSLPCNA